ELVNKLDIADKVLFLGRQKNIRDLLSISDIKLLMSEKESFGLVLLEAMSCEVVPIATNVGGIQEVIDNGYNGYKVAIGDVEIVADKTLNLLNDDVIFEYILQLCVINILH